MSQNVSLEFSPWEQHCWEIWELGKENGLSDEKIAINLHRTRRTITRLKGKAKRNGKYAEWLEKVVGRATETNCELIPFLKKKNPYLLFIENNKIILRAMTTKIQSETEIKQELEIHTHKGIDWDAIPKDEKRLLENALRVYIRRRSTKTSEREPIPIH